MKMALHWALVQRCIFKRGKPRLLSIPGADHLDSIRFEAFTCIYSRGMLSLIAMEL